jgi:tripartite ATP-independent transporter DctM subunit
MMSLAIIVVLLLFVLGAPVFAVMVGFAFLGAVHTAREGVMSEWAAELAEIARLGTGEPAQVLSTIPLFILAGYIMAESRTADRMVRFAQATLGWMPGGLAVVTIGACALFTTFTGASGVTIVALGGLLMPSLLKEKYPERFSLGLIAGTGSVGLLFPPALPLFVYGTVYGVNDQLTGGDSGFTTDRFLFAGIVPGLVLIGLLALMAIAVAVYRKVPRRGFDLIEWGKSFVIALPELILPFLIIGALLTGIAIPEIAALTVLYVLSIEILLYRDLRFGSLWRIVRESMALVGAIFIIIFAASALTNYFVTAEVPTMLVDWISEHVDAKWKFLLALNIFLIAVGMMMDIFSAIVIVVPLITPLAKQYGIDPFHLGVIFLLNLEIGYLTPPVGLNLFITSFKFQRPVVEVIRATVPFLAAMIIALGVVTYVPALTVVPEAKRTGRLADLVAMVQQASASLTSVQEITLADGKVKKLIDCQNDPNRLQCEELFAAVTECRKQNSSTCEKDATSAYMQAIADDLDDWDDDDDPDADDADADDPDADGDF